RKHCFVIVALLFISLPFVSAQKKSSTAATATIVPDAKLLNGMKWRQIGPFRAGRCLAVTGIDKDPMTYYAGQVGGGVWKTIDGGNTWICVSDTTFKSSSVGAIGVAKNNPNILYVGMGE